MLFLNQNWLWNGHKKYWTGWSVWNVRRRKGVWYTFHVLTSPNVSAVLENRSSVRYVANSSKKKFARIEYKSERLRHEPTINSPSNYTRLWCNGTKNSSGFFPILWRNRFFLFVTYKKAASGRLEIMQSFTTKQTNYTWRQKTWNSQTISHRLQAATKLCTSRKN